MIKGCVHISQNINEVEAKGHPAALYAEICEIINDVLQTMDTVTQQKIKNKLSNDAEWHIINLLVRYNERYLNEQ